MRCRSGAIHRRNAITAFMPSSLSGSPFTPRRRPPNQRSWLYRIRPAVKHSGRYRKVDKRHLRTAPCREDTDTPIGQMRWSPVPITRREDQLRRGFVHGDDGGRRGYPGRHGRASALRSTRAMQDEYFFNADGELLIVAQENRFALLYGSSA